MCRVLRLEVLDYTDPARWLWRLTDNGVFLADHQVVIDRNAWQFEAFTDLHRYLKWNAAPDRRLAHEADLVGQVGDWISEVVLGPICGTLATQRRPVRVEIPQDAGGLAYLPWELARFEGRTLAEYRVGFIIDQPHRSLAKAPVGDRLRMLAIFSLPEDAGALNLRKERFALAKLVHEIAAVHSKGIELRVLQYGATRERLSDALLEGPGWDVVHLSGHGLPSGLVFEDDAGGRDQISSPDLVDLLDLAANQIKLVTLSACESAAVTAAEHLHLLGLAPAVRAEVGDEGSLPAVATEVARRLDCAVLAMRYPVVDDFAIALSRSFYELVFGKGQPVARALSLSLQQVRSALPAVPVLSVATPTLFGASADDLRLIPPPGGPVVFDVEKQRLEEFPSQPERFVGRVGPMTRATSALAPRSGYAGVLFHGMAGAGKTACALELAYTHDLSFPYMAWYAAPPEGHDIASALTDFALALERQLDLKIVHLVNDVEAFRQMLPGLTALLENNRVLIVLDNIESLIAESGEWRDERWAMLIEAMTSHRGLSRVVLTSRLRPKVIKSVVVEPVHALSLREAVLLSRELPNLRALMDTDPALAVRALSVVQGHPKLIELAEGIASDVDKLAERLDGIDQTWSTRGAQLEPFLRGDGPAATDDDYVAALEGWTRVAAAALPADSARLFQFLCCVEEGDRENRTIGLAWADAPDLDVAVKPLLEQALVSGDSKLYRIHPGVAETGRDIAGTEFAEAVDIKLAAHWLTVLSGAKAHESDQQLGWLVRHAAQAAVPYLARQNRWAELLGAVESVLYRDSTHAAAAALMPVLATAAEAAGSTALGMKLRHYHARALGVSHPEQAWIAIGRLLEEAIAGNEFLVATVLSVDLIELHTRAGQFDQALALTDATAEYAERAGLGPWSRLAHEGYRLRILREQGHFDQVLAEVMRLRAVMADLPDLSGIPEAELVEPWNAREAILSDGVHAADWLGRWQESLDLNAEMLASMRARGANAIDQAKAAFAGYPSLLNLGKVTDALHILRECRRVFESGNCVPELASTLSGLAAVEDKLGHADRAADCELSALRIKYGLREPTNIANAHYNLSKYLYKLGTDLRYVGAHLMAGAIIAHQIGSHILEVCVETMRVIGEVLTVPESFGEVCAVVDEVDGVHLAELVEWLPRRAPDGQSAMDEVLRLAAGS